jgi:hypothetical protein
MTLLKAYLSAALSAVILATLSSAQTAQPDKRSAPPQTSFGSFRKGPGRRVGEIRFSPPGFIYSLVGDHCEIGQERILCLFTFEQHQGNQHEWAAKDAWVENFAVDQFGERHYKTSAFYLSTRGVRQEAFTMAPGDKVFFVQEFEGGEKAISSVTIVSPHGQIRNLGVE